MQDNFSFEADNLSYGRIERAICRACGLQDADSSNLPLVLTPEKFYPVKIVSQNGSVSCKVIAYESSNSEKSCYNVFVSNIAISSR